MNSKLSKMKNNKSIEKELIMLIFFTSIIFLMLAISFIWLLELSNSTEKELIKIEKEIGLINSSKMNKTQISYSEMYQEINKTKYDYHLTI